MILRIFGAAAVVVCCSALGMKCAGGYAAKVRTLRALIGTLTVARSEICDLLSPMPELIDMLSAQAPAHARGFGRACDVCMRAGMPFPQAWERASEELKHTGETAAEAVARLGGFLGRFDGETQRTELTRTIAILDGELAAAEAQRGSRGKTCAALGVGVGVMLAIILI